MSGNAIVMSPPWRWALLVCKDCRKRKDGPAKLKPKVIASALKSAAQRARHRPRVVLTSCLGICPKGATAIGAAGGEIGSRVAIVRSIGDLERVVPLLFGDADHAT